MKKTLLAFAGLAASVICSHAALLISDTFTYPDGDLATVSGGLWVVHSSGTIPVNVSNNQAVVRMTSTSAADIHYDYPSMVASNSGTTLYTSYKLTTLNIPALQGTYISHHRDTNGGALTGFGARVWLSATNIYTSAATPADKFRIGIVNGNAGGPGVGQLDQDLDTNVTYTVVTRFVLATGVATLWINPVNESSPSITATDIGTNGVVNPLNVVSYCFRQGSQNPNQAGFNTTNLVDNLKVGTTFGDVLGAPTISGIVDQYIAGNGSTGPIPFQVQDDQTPATGLTVSATSSNTVLVPNAPANIVLGGTSTNRTITINPASGQQGVTEITVSVNDGTFTSTSKFLVFVGVPSIAAIPNQNTPINTTLSSVPVLIGDAESAASALNLRGTSSNPTLVTTGGISFGGSSSNRTVTVAPQAGQTGISTITIYVDDGVNTNSTSFVLSVSPLLGTLLSDTFSYPDGSLWLTGPWTTHASPTGTNFGQMTVSNGMVHLSRNEAEDLAADLTGGPFAPSSGAVIYSGFQIMFTELPSNLGNYFFHLKDSLTGTTFRSKVFGSATNAAAGKFRIGVSVSANDASPSFPRDLSLKQPYIVVTKYNVGSGDTRLWVNPTSESSPSVAATDLLLTSAIASVGLRQDTGIGTNYLDDLVISGSAFSDVVPVVTAPTLLSSVAGGNITLTWSNPLFALQSAVSVNGPFSDVTNAVSPYVTSLSGDQQYFRLKY